MNDEHNIPFDDLIKEFYQSVDTDLTIHDFTQVCRAPWRLLKDSILSDEIHFFRFKYFGIFRTTPQRVKYLRKLAESRYNNGDITREEYYRQRNMCEKFLKDEL